MCSRTSSRRPSQKHPGGSTLRAHPVAEQRSVCSRLGRVVLVVVVIAVVVSLTRQKRGKEPRRLPQSPRGRSTPAFPLAAARLFVSFFFFFPPDRPLSSPLKKCQAGSHFLSEDPSRITVNRKPAGLQSRRMKVLRDLVPCGKIASSRGTRDQLERLPNIIIIIIARHACGDVTPPPTSRHPLHYWQTYETRTLINGEELRELLMNKRV